MYSMTTVQEIRLLGGNPRTRGCPSSPRWSLPCTQLPIQCARGEAEHGRRVVSLPGASKGLRPCAQSANGMVLAFEGEKWVCVGEACISRSVTKKIRGNAQSCLPHSGLEARFMGLQHWIFMDTGPFASEKASVFSLWSHPCSSFGTVG